MEDLHHDRHSYVAAWALFAYPMNEKRVDVTSYLQLVPSSDVEELTPRSCAGCFTAAMSCCTTRFVCTRRAHSCARAPGAPRPRTRRGRGRARDRSDARARDILKYRLDSDITAEVAREVARAYPDDWRAQMLLARALHDGDEARAAFTRACELAAQNPALVTPCLPR